jgi:histidine triad (HIT) family protein
LTDCIFCKIANGLVAGRVIYEDAYTCVFLDIVHDVDGHMLAVPKKHVKSILDCDEQTLMRLMQTVKKVAEHCTQQCGYEGVNLLNASGGSAGQSVSHFHIRLIPRRQGDEVDAWPRLPGATLPDEEMRKKLRMPS